MKYNRSEFIKAGVREGFQNGTSKYANRRCYGYDVTADGSLVINPDEAKIVRWMFQRYLHGDSLGKIASCLEKQGILSPTGKSKWKREAIDKLLSNEKYIGCVLLQKTVSVGGCQIQNTGFRISTFTLLIMNRLFLVRFSMLYRMKRNVDTVNNFA